MRKFLVAADHPESADMQALLQQHLAFARQASPPEDVHALDVTGLLADNVS